MLRLISLSFYPKPARVHFVALFRDEAWAGFVGTGRIAGGLWPIVENEEKTVRARLGAFLGAALSASAVLGVIALAVTDHRHRAVMLMVAVLVGMGIVRLWTPGRPWFASRGRLADAIVYVILAAIIWYLAPFVSTMAVR